MNRRKTGSVYERRAEEYLSARGYRVLERNYRCRQGEIDLIALDGRYLVFVEVKYRADARAGYGPEAVDARKQQRIAAAAAWYLYATGKAPDRPCRFDVVSFLGDEPTLIRDAFQIGDRGRMLC